MSPQTSTPLEVVPAQEVTVLPCSCDADCEKVAALCGSSFPEEVHSQGLSVQQWSQIEADDLKATRSWWPQIGLAWEGEKEKLLGVVVLTVENEADDSISWSEYSRRVGCGPTILSMLYDRVLDEALLEHECLIDFIAVSPEARGKGVGSKLMSWAEEAGSKILAEMETAAVAAHGVEMTLWVAADNAAAVRLYERSGYTQVKRTDTGACRCMASAVLNWFLGHPVWIKMHKVLPAPAHLAAVQPTQQSVAALVPTCAAVTTAAASTAAPEASPFEMVPLDDPITAAAAARQQQPATPHSPGSSLMHKLSHGLLGSTAAASAGETPRSSGTPAGAGATCTVGSAGAAHAGSQALTPRIAAVGGGLPSVAAGLASNSTAVGGHGKAGSFAQATSKPLHAPGPLVEQHQLPQSQQGAKSVGAPSNATTASVASASVASWPLESGSDSDGEEQHSDKHGVQSCSHTAQCGAVGPEVFELVALSTSSLTVGASAT